MRVICPECHQKARIQKTNRISSGYADLYCACSDAECGHTFVMSLSFSHTLSPSAKTASQLAFDLVKVLAPEQRNELKKQLAIL
ncbi:transcriptional regulator [Vibrio fluvialis]|uniref:ogr/Delta-like zinc finger family protein n=1 Tax=Vibrio fluvialis TaxID=676 RepID=UPI00117C9B2A|nr:ogr/Delta-like zinc finger family protein [Vibrio fluvialis]TRN17451.1 transcriptional regulator [Vibrio fluvialis]